MTFIASYTNTQTLLAAAISQIACNDVVSSLTQWSHTLMRLGPDLYYNDGRFINDRLEVFCPHSGDHYLEGRLHQEGVRALLKLSEEDRQDFFARVSPYVNANLHHAIINDAVHLEQSVGVIRPLRMALFGQREAAADDFLQAFYQHYPRRWHRALSLEPPATPWMGLPQQIIYPTPRQKETLAANPEDEGNKIVPIHQHRPSDQLDLKRLAAWDLPGYKLPQFQNQHEIALPSTRQLRLGGLTVMSLNAEDLPYLTRSDAGNELRVVDILLLGGQMDKNLYYDLSNLLWLSEPLLTVMSCNDQDFKKNLEQYTYVIDLNPARNIYGLLEFDPTKRGAPLDVRTLDITNGQQITHNRLSMNKKKRVDFVLQSARPRLVDQMTEELRGMLESGLLARGRSESAFRYNITRAAEYIAGREMNPYREIRTEELILQEIQNAFNNDILDSVNYSLHHIFEWDHVRAFEIMLGAWGMGAP